MFVSARRRPFQWLTLSILLGLPLLVELLYGGGISAASIETNQHHVFLPNILFYRQPRLVFVSYRDGNAEIYTTLTGSSDIVRLTTHPATERYPRLTKQADRIVFVSNRDGNDEIYSMNVDGTGLIRLTNDPAQDTTPTWSPDGRRIAFASNRSGKWAIYMMNADGSEQGNSTLLTDDSVMPAWSPDGAYIAYVDLLNPETDDRGRIMLLMANNPFSSRYILTNYLRYLESPVWAPDSSQLAIAYDSDDDGWNELATVKIEELGRQLGTLKTIYEPGRNLEDVLPGSWSRDGTSLLFSRIGYAVQNNRLVLDRLSIEQISPTGGPPQPVIPAQNDWQPDLK